MGALWPTYPPPNAAVSGSDSFNNSVRLFPVVDAFSLLDPTPSRLFCHRDESSLPVFTPLQWNFAASNPLINPNNGTSPAATQIAAGFDAVYTINDTTVYPSPSDLLTALLNATHLTAAGVFGSAGDYRLIFDPTNPMAGAPRCVGVCCGVWFLVRPLLSDSKHPTLGLLFHACACSPPQTHRCSTAPTTRSATPLACRR